MKTSPLPQLSVERSPLRLQRVVPFLLIVLTLLLDSSSPAHAAPLRAGAAVRMITPDPLLPVSGGVGPSHAVSKKLGDLTVRALVLESSGTRVAIISADLLGFPSALGDQVRALLPNFPAENIVIGASHTHSAPDCYGFPDGQGGFAINLPYVKSICGKMAEAVQEASAQLQTVQLKAASGEARGKIAYNYYAEQLYDPRCHVLQFVNTSGRTVATLVNYAIHPEVLGPDQGILSPDLVGPLYDRIQQRAGGIALFMNSAQGGMVTADCRGPDGKDIQTWGECVRIGELLADEALRIIASAPLESAPVLRNLATRIAFPIDSPLLKAVLAQSPLGYRASSDGSISTQVNLIQLGAVQILTIPGEALPNIGYYLKRKMRGQHNLLFGLTNDAFGYILAKEDWGSFKRYEYITRTSLGERTGEVFVNAALDLIASAEGEAPK